MSKEDVDHFTDTDRKVKAIVEEFKTTFGPTVKSLSSNAPIYADHWLFAKLTPLVAQDSVNITICPIHGNKEHKVEPTHYCRYKIDGSCKCRCLCAPTPTVKEAVLVVRDIAYKNRQEAFEAGRLEGIAEAVAIVDSLVDYNDDGIWVGMETAQIILSALEAIKNKK